MCWTCVGRRRLICLIFYPSNSGWMWMDGRGEFGPILILLAINQCQHNKNSHTAMKHLSGWYIAIFLSYIDFLYSIFAGQVKIRPKHTSHQQREENRCPSDLHKASREESLIYIHNVICLQTLIF